MRFAATLLLFLSAAKVNADENGCCRWPGDNRACDKSDCWAEESMCSGSAGNWVEANIDCDFSAPNLNNPGGCCRFVTDDNPKCVASTDCWIQSSESTCPPGVFKWVPDNNLDCESLPGWGSGDSESNNTTDENNSESNDTTDKKNSESSTATTAKTATAAATTAIAGGIVTFLM